MSEDGPTTGIETVTAGTRPPVQASLKEILIAVAVLGAIFAVARLVGGLSGFELAAFVIAAASTLLATGRLFSWLGVGVLFAVMIGLASQASTSDPGFAIFAAVVAFLGYGLVGTPVAIASARGLHLRRWLVSEFGILTVAVALTPADPVSTLLVYTPLQLAMLGYVFFAKDGAEMSAGS